MSWRGCASHFEEPLGVEGSDVLAVTMGITAEDFQVILILCTSSEMTHSETGTCLHTQWFDIRRGQSVRGCTLLLTLMAYWYNRSASFVITSLGVALNTAILIQILAASRSLVWLPDEDSGNKPETPVDVLQLIWALFALYFASAAAICTVGLVGVVKVRCHCLPFILSLINSQKEQAIPSAPIQGLFYRRLCLHHRLSFGDSIWRVPLAGQHPDSHL